MKPFPGVFVLGLLMAAPSFAASPARQLAGPVHHYVQWEITDLGPHGDFTGYYICRVSPPPGLPPTCGVQGYKSNIYNQAVWVNQAANAVAEAAGMPIVLSPFRNEVPALGGVGVEYIGDWEAAGHVDPEKAESTFSDFVEHYCNRIRIHSDVQHSQELLGCETDGK